MSADVLQSPAPDTRPLYRLLRRTRTLLRSSWVLTGFGFTAGLLLSVVVAVALLDLVVPLPPALRLTALLLVIVPTAVAFLLGIVRPLGRRLGNVVVARRIEEHLPGIHNRLVSCVSLEANAPKQAASPAFYRRLLTEGLERARAFRPWRVVDALRLRRAGAFAPGSGLALALAWVLFSDRLPTALARIGEPFADIPPASGVRYDIEPGNAEFSRGDAIEFTATVTTAKEPDGLRLEIEPDGSGKALHYNLKRSEDDPKVWTTTLETAGLGEGFDDGFTYRVRGGGTWSKQYHVRLAEIPVLKRVKVQVHFPSYMAIKEPRPVPPDASAVTGPEGGEVEVIVEAQGEVARGAVQLLVPGKRKLSLREQEKSRRIWFEDKLPVGTNSEGTWQWTSRDGRKAHTEPPAVGTHGHWFQGDPAGHAVGTGDELFADVWVSSQQPPRSILLQWHDGSGWDHGVFWGADVFAEGKANSASRRHAGSLPATGKWVRLSVPADAVGLEGKTLRGMAFKLDGGQCFWARAGTIRTTEPAPQVDKSFALREVRDGVWAGRFPLVGQGKFRPELRNKPGKPNQERKALSFVALPDQPPAVVLERPGRDVALGKAAAVPLTIAAYDDYGLAGVDLLWRTTPTGDYKKRTLRRYDKPVRGQSFKAVLTEVAKLSAGGELFYVIEARDRKGQTTRTREYVVRVANDPNADDKQLEAFEKTQDTFLDRLVKLMGDQKQVQDEVGKLEARYADISEKAREAYAKAQAEADAVKPMPGKPAPPVPAPKLDPETAKQLAALQAELAKLAQKEAVNAAAAEQLNKDLAQAVKHAESQALLSGDFAKQMQAMQQAFQQAAVSPLRDLAQAMQQGANPKTAPPDLKAMKDKSDRVQKELEAIKNRMDALAKARKGLRDDLLEAMRELQRRMLNEAGGLTERELKELQDYLAKMAEKMKALEAKQAELFNKAGKDKDPAQAAKDQADLEKDLERMLAEARNLLKEAKKRKKARDPEFPESPFVDDGREEKVPPKEDDTDEPLPGKKDKKTDKGDKPKPGDKKDDKKKDDDEDEPLFMPALGGPKPVADKRFDKKRRPVKRKPGEKDDAEARREDLQNQQERNLRNLEAARKSLDSDRQTLAQMMKQLQQAMQRNGRPGKQQPGEQGDPTMEALQQMLQSPQMRQAMQMLARMRQGPPRGQGQQANGPRSPMPMPATTGNLDGSPVDGSGTAELAKLDPTTRGVLLKLPPRIRDDLLQGMREQGPAGYDEFIREYFKRLTEDRGPGK